MAYRTNKSPDGFSKSVKKFSTDSPQKLNRVRKAVIIKLFSAIIKDTPVLEGRLRSNWNFSTGGPDLSTKDGIVSESFVLNGVIESTLRTTNSDVVHLSNNLPYAYFIEYGGSKGKSPEGMVRKNVTRFKILLKQALGENNTV